MPTFKYIGGMEFNNGDHQSPTVKLPAETTLGGIEFIRGQATAVEPHMFGEQAKFEHVVMKLRKHRHFQEVVIEDAKFEDIPPDRPAKRSKPAAPPAEAPPE